MPKRELFFLPQAWEDYLYWQETNKKTLRRINELIKDIQKAPFSGLGKPEPLKFDLAGVWSRRIDHEHRLLYKIEGTRLILIQCRYHYL